MLKHPSQPRKITAPRKSRKVKIPALTKAQKKEKERQAQAEADRKLRLFNLGHYMHKLPFEIREYIFKDVLHDDTRVSPALVAALRGTEFYYQVLKLWYDGTYMRWGEGRGPNSYSLRDSSAAALLMVKKLRVDHKVCRFNISWWEKIRLLRVLIRYLGHGLRFLGRKARRKIPLPRPL